MTTRVSESLRALVRDRAGGRCEYCHIHEDDAFYPHQPGHIIAEKHGGLTQEDNLVWSCFLCNHYKGPDIASVDHQTGRIVPLFHPRRQRRQRWRRHFRLIGARIEPLTAQGRATAALLRLNHPASVAVRQQLLESGRFAGFSGESAQP